MQNLLRSEKKIRSKETQETSAPHSIRSYEKALLSSPNSSFLWIKYSAYLHDNFGIEKSRQALTKAISKIDPSEEREKLNLHLALINLEHAFGSKESFEKAFIKALTSNNPEKILRHKVKKLIDTNQLEEAEDYLKILCKKHRKNLENWESLLRFYLIQGKDEEKYQETIRRASQSVDDVVELKKKVGMLEYSIGAPEKGRTIFENLISEKSKRSDIWMVYINLEMKISGIEAVRDLFERVLSLKLSQKTLKSFARTYYQYETEKHHGNKAQEIASRFNLEI